jgi:hypothetical protein
LPLRYGWRCDVPAINDTTKGRFSEYLAICGGLKMKRIIVCMASFALIAGCSIGDDVPSGAVEGVLDVVVGMGSFDPNKGRTFEPVISVRLEEGTYPLSPVEGATIIGLEDQDLLFMNGASILVRGEIKDGRFMADYVKFLDSGEQGVIELGVPVPGPSAASGPMQEPAISDPAEAPPGPDVNQE